MTTSRTRHPGKASIRLMAVLLAAGGALLLFTLIGPASTATTGGPEPLAYPKARRAADVDKLHGHKVPDPYRWMEDMSSPETRDWARGQDDLAREVIHRLPGFGELEKRLQEVNRFETVSAPVPRGNNIFFTRRGAEEQQSTLYVRSGIGAEPRILVDANDHPGKSLRSYSPSPDGKRVIYGLAPVGSSWAEWRIKDVASGKDLPDRLVGIRYGRLAWHPDSRELFYLAYDVPKAGTELQAALGAPKLHRHRVGSGEADPVIFERPENPSWFYNLGITEDGKYLVMTVAEGSAPESRVLLLDLEAEDPKSSTAFDALIPEPVASYSFLGDRRLKSGGHRLYFRTDRDSPRSRIVAVDLGDGSEPEWQEIIPQSTEVLSFASLVADHFLGFYLKDAVPEVRIFDRQGRFQRRLELPQRGTSFSGFVGRRTDPAAYFTVNSVALTSTPYRLDPTTGKVDLVVRPESSFDPEDFVLEQVFYRSEDGTRIPMFLAYKKGLDPKKNRPTMMYGYGAYGWSAFPWFQPNVVVWMELGGIYALPGIRGGGEYGESWHKAGSGRKKENSIADFLSAAEFLVENGYTSPDKLAARGGSASGMLAGAALVRRPDLFSAVLINIPVLDLIRGHLLTSGAYRFAEFGSPENAGDLEVLLRYSPYHNVEAGTCYPATLLYAGEKDETAPPVHAYKFAAALQHAQERTRDDTPCREPVLLKIGWGAGHSVAATAKDRPEAWASQLAFLAWKTGLSTKFEAPAARVAKPRAVGER